MKLNITESELIECIKNATQRILNEGELVGDDGTLDNMLDVENEEPDYEYPEENYEDEEDVYPEEESNYEDVEEEPTDDLGDVYNDLGIIPGEKEIDDEPTVNSTVHISTDLDLRADADLISQIEEEFGIMADTDVHSGNVVFDVPSEILGRFKDYANENEFDANEDTPLNEGRMPCEPYKVTTDGRVFWMRESKAVENVDTFKFRMNENYRRNCWKNYVRGKFVM